MTLNYENISIPEATNIQNELRTKLDISEREIKINTIAGADISMNLHGSTIYAGIILLSFPELQPIAYSLLKSETSFPYIPGFLGFREVPALVKVWEQIPVKPDVLIIDGHGIAHPRRTGVAAHFGAITGQVSMGCAKDILCGQYDEPATEQDSYSPIIDKREQIGYAYRSKAKTAPIYVSPGHLMGMNTSLQIMRQCVDKYRVPAPTRLAHELVNRFRKGELQEGYYKM